MQVLGMGLALPGPPIATEALVAHVERQFGLRLGRAATVVAQLLGIERRHLSRDLAAVGEATRPGDGNADLAARAVGAALVEAGLLASDLGYLIGHTATPDTMLPAGITWVADRLRYQGPQAEFRQACTGFANALVMARGVLDAGQARAVAIVGSETGSVYFDPRRAGSDQSQLVNLLQMGDAAACIIVGPDEGRGDRLDHLAFGSIGLDLAPGLALRDGGSARPAIGGAVAEFDHDFATVRRVGADLFMAGAQAARDFGVDLASVRAVIPHQANGRLDALLAEPLGVEPGAIVTMARRVGNTGSAAMWAALAELRPRLAPGETAIALGAEATKHNYATFRFRKG